MNEGQPSFGRVLAVAMSPVVAIALPTLLTGTLAGFLRRDLGIDEAAFGLAIGSSRLAAAASSAPLGRLTERWPPRVTLRAGAIGAIGVTLGIASLSRSWGSLVLFLVAAGLLTAMTQASTDLWLSEQVEPQRQGLAFGAKQSAVPVAAFLAGIAVPSLAVSIGWRETFIAAAFLGLIGLVVIPRKGKVGGPVVKSKKKASRSGDLSGRTLLLLAIGQGLGAAGGTALIAFLVLSAITTGVTDALAGVLFAVGSLIAVLTRIIMGHLADRHSTPSLLVIAGMFVVGSVAYALLGIGSPILTVVIAPVAFASGWGWPGLFVFSVVRTNPGSPAAGAAATRSGAYIGGIVGPAVFGVLATSSYRLAWTVTAGWALAAALMMLLGHRLVDREIAERRNL